MTPSLLPLVHVIGMGGTIAVNADDRLDLSDYVYVWQTGQYYTIDEFMTRIPEVAAFAQVRATQFASAGSIDFQPRHWLDLVREVNIALADDGVAGVVVTHGTATLEETAFFLNLTVKGEKPVVVTGSMRPPSALSSDADLNLVDSIRVAALGEARDKGVLVVLNNQIHASRDVAKSHTTRLDTFASADFGALGMVSADHQVAFYRGPQRSHTSHTEFDVSNVDDLARVDIVAGYLGADGTLVRAAVDAGAAGIVISGLGAGYSTPSIMEAVKEATGNGVVVALSSQASGGRVAMTRGFKDAGVVVADNLSPKKARILLMLALTVTNNVDRIQQMMATY